jgi:hypothetical protein
MSNNPTPAILRHFYGLIGLEALVIGVGVAVVYAVWRHRHGGAPVRWPPSDLWGRALLRWAFGGLWILDGLLQAQPAMASDFVPNYLVPLLDGQPFWFMRIMESGVVLWGYHPIVWDSLVVWLQIGIGLLILVGGDTRWGRLGLYLSLAWSVVVWTLGEGLAGLLVPGHATWLAGTPGSVVFYGVAAVLLLVSPGAWESGRVTAVMARFFAVLWLFLGMLQLLPGEGFWQGATLAQPTLAMALMAQPALFSAPLYAVAHLLTRYPVPANAVIGGVMLALGYGWWFRTRWVVPATIVWALLTWWLAQDFGVLGGLGTDPNAGLPLVALVVATQSPRARRRLWQSTGPPPDRDEQDLEPPATRAR